MPEPRHRPFWGSGLFWKVSAIFLVVLLVFAGITLKIHIDTSRNYALEVAQRLNHDLAAHTVSEIRPFLNGEVAEEKIGTLMHSMMAVNPSIEVYVLDTAGRILKYVALEGAVKLDSVRMGPIRQFLSGPKDQVPIVGDDPRTPGEQKIFSAAPVEENGHVEGYVYIILASQEYAGAAATLFDSYFLRLGSRSILFALLLTLVGGLFAIYFITMDLGRIITGFRRFQSGDLGARIHLSGRGALGEVATTFNDMATTIERNIEELKGVDRLRKELIGNVSHDLRTPIAAIQGYAETLLMKEGHLSADEKKEHLTTIMQSAERLRRLVDDLFTLSKLEAGQTELELEPLSLGELVHDVVNKLRLLAKEKNVSINIIMAKDLPIVEVDVRQIDRVLQNLLHNAIKFCRPGDHITVELDGTRPDAVEVRISDTGIGIPEDELPHIFDRYFSGSRSLKGDGAGLGLAIVKRILQMHGSDVEVSSKPDAGSTFSFTLRSHIA
ncbi:MAG: HAMP domain-containing histidine kinase [Flavobacteriales bacterium]|nr:HAMP domain-containing histidine kinase [Flavobacteriales bacterium]MCB9192940.1 HAMP domain-containing histidine kinase [Flavobacteriales bacterium]